MTVETNQLESTLRAKRRLFFEERVAIVSRALNLQTVAIGAKMPEKERREFRQFVSDMMAVLDGDLYGEARRRLEKSNG